MPEVIAGAVPADKQINRTVLRIQQGDLTALLGGVKSIRTQSLVQASNS
jgi:hypothetical protein